jgi:hypothetical protein
VVHLRRRLCGNGNEVIIGIPAIVLFLWNFFKENFEKRIAKYTTLGLTNIQLQGDSLLGSCAYAYVEPDEDWYWNDDPPDREGLDRILNAIEDLRSPWSSNPRDTCPEDDAVGIPVQFEWAQAFLGKSHEEAVSEYHALWADHVSPEMAANTPILKLLAGKAQQVFVPTTWEGIIGLGDLDFNFDANMPGRIKPKARHINPKMWEDAEKEFTRMRGYFYEETRSPWASCLVIAPKATPPFIRICGYYVGINKYISTVRYEINKIVNYPFYLDIDLTNAFHQIPLTLATSERLSVQTPWGQF